MAAKKKPVQKGATPATEGAILRVRTKPGVSSFRRAGRAFGREAVDIPATELSQEQQEALQAEPRLVVEVIEGEKPQE